MFYACVAQVVKTTPTGTISYQVPTFYLNSHVQGIVSKEHAAKIAQDVINPTRDASIQVHVTVETISVSEFE